MADRYWVGGTDTWNNTAGLKWSTTSGGAGGAAVPTTADDVYFDANSGSGTVTASSLAGNCLNLDFTGFTGTITGANFALHILGSFTLAAGMTWSGTGSLSFESTSTGRTINLAGKTLDNAITFNGAGGGWTLASDLIQAPSVSSGMVTLTEGALDDGGFDVTIGAFSSSNTNTRSLTRTGLWTILGNSINNTIWGTGTSTNMTHTGSGAIIVADAGSGSRSFNAGTFPESQAPSFDITTGTWSTAMNNSWGSLDFTGFSGTLTSSSTRTIYGDLTLSAGMTIDAAAAGFLFNPTSGTKTITSNGHVLDLPIAVNAPGATIQLGDDLELASTRTLTLTAGGFDTNDFNVTAGAFNGGNSNVRTLSMGSGDWTMTGTGTVWDTNASTNLTLNEETSRIIINDASASTKTFDGGNETFNDILLTGAGTGAFNFIGNNTFNDFAADTPPHTIQFTAGSTTTVASWNVSGTAGNLMTIGSITASNHSLTKTGDRVVADYLSISRSQASPSTLIWYAGQHSTDGGNNAGWIFDQFVDPSLGFAMFP